MRVENALAQHLQVLHRNAPATPEPKAPSTQNKVICKTPPLMPMQIRLLRKEGISHQIARLLAPVGARRTDVVPGMHTGWTSSSFQVSDNTAVPARSNLSSQSTTFLLRCYLSKRRDCVQKPDHIVWRHLAVLQAADLAALTQALQTERKFPALGFVDQEDVLLAVSVAD